MGGIMKAIGGLFAPPQMPKIKKEVMPDPASPVAKQAARAKIADRNKGGRDSTIFTGQAYTGTNLAGT